MSNSLKINHQCFQSAENSLLKFIFLIFIEFTPLEVLDMFEAGSGCIRAEDDSEITGCLWFYVLVVVFLEEGTVLAVEIGIGFDEGVMGNSTQFLRFVIIDGL